MEREKIGRNRLYNFVDSAKSLAHVVGLFLAANYTPLIPALNDAIPIDFLIYKLLKRNHYQLAHARQTLTRIIFQLKHCQIFFLIFLYSKI